MKCIILILFPLVAIGQSSLFDSLQGCYDFNGNPNDPIHMLNGINGSVQAATDRYNIINACYEFSGNPSSIITLPDDPRLKAPAMTICAWAYCYSTTGSYIVFAKNPFSSYHEAYCIATDYYNGKFVAAKVNSYGVYYAHNNVATNVNTWYHLATTVDSTHIALYVNGSLVSYVSSPGYIEYQAGKNVRIGGSGESYFPAPFSGKIDNVRFYNRVLSASEIFRIYQADPKCIGGEPAVMSEKRTPSLSVFPNPTEGKFIIQKQNAAGNVTVSVMDFLGKYLWREDFKNRSELTVDLSSFAKGIYILKLTEDGNSSTHKIIVE